MPDDGDPRLAAPIWVGRYELVPESGVSVSNETVMLSKQNMVQILGDADGVTADQTFATLPEECCPDEEISLPIVVDGNVGILSVSPIGELSCNLSGKVRLNGINFHICSNYY